MVFFEKPEAKLRNGTLGFRGIALMTVLAEWYAAVMVGLLQARADRMKGIACTLGRRGGSIASTCRHDCRIHCRDIGSGGRIGEMRGFWGFLKSHIACVASLDVRTAFDVA